MRLIDADALKEQIEDFHCKDCDNYNFVRCRACHIDDAITYLDEAPTISGWISVKDRLPDVKDNVLWYAVKNDGYGEIRISSFSGAINHDIPHVWGYGESFKPIYWMPLPEPPEEGKPKCD